MEYNVDGIYEMVGAMIRQAVDDVKVLRRVRKRMETHYIPPKRKEQLLAQMVVYEQAEDWLFSPTGLQAWIRTFEIDVNVATIRELVNEKDVFEDVYDKKYNSAVRKEVVKRKKTT